MNRIYVVGIGSGKKENMTFRAFDALNDSDIIVGYSSYIKLIENNFKYKELVSFPMKKEKERCKFVINEALKNKKVSLISSGDSGIYGMSGILLEILTQKDYKIDVKIIPGVTALNFVSALLGAPLMHDFAVISLSDLMTPWEVIEKRLKYAVKGDFVIGIYNPKSKGRSKHIYNARDIIVKYRSELTPVGIVKNAGRDNEEINITNLKSIENYNIDMFTTIIIGNSTTYTKMNKIITPRGYKI
jgi:precorrin-3B C17-methyltransferase